MSQSITTNDHMFLGARGSLARAGRRGGPPWLPPKNGVTLQRPQKPRRRPGPKSVERLNLRGAERRVDRRARRCRAARDPDRRLVEPQPRRRQQQRPDSHRHSAPLDRQLGESRGRALDHQGGGAHDHGNARDATDDARSLRSRPQQAPGRERDAEVDDSAGDHMDGGEDAELCRHRPWSGTGPRTAAATRRTAKDTSGSARSSRRRSGQ